MVIVKLRVINTKFQVVYIKMQVWTFDSVDNDVCFLFVASPQAKQRDEAGRVNSEESSTGQLAWLIVLVVKKQRNPTQALESKED